MNTAPFQYAGFWKRFTAFSIDFMLVFITVLYMALFAWLPLFFYSDWTEEQYVQIMLWGLPSLWLGLYLIMEVVMTTVWGASFGKLAMEIKVANAQGGRISLPRSLGRFVLKLPGVFLLGLGILPLLFNSKRKALHDFAVSSVVIRKDEPC